ncbi:uncharacterized protein [Prorops nasuta]|uniref:uncharacterized protein n=1 Tax=Prorops nasuta TaxID=863751 RepID=UPI0034CDDA38
MDLPFCPTHDLSPVNSKHKKLLTTLYDKKRYVIHIRMLKTCLKHGLQLDKIHRILQFKQKEWLRVYIELNMELRVKANNDFEKNLYKLMDNAAFGKNMENVRNHVDVKLFTVWDGRYSANSYISKPNFHSRAIFNENLMAIKMNRLCVTINKPIYVVPVLMKDENIGYIMKVFIGLRSKMYAIQVLDKCDIKKIKGISSNVVKRNTSFQDYLDCLYNQDIKVSLQGRINSKLHKVYSILEEKIALNPYDDKRFIMDDFINTLPWGHFKSKEKHKKCKDRE